MMTEKKHKSGKGKVLIIGGGIANFTDVANTFTGIIQALREYSDKLKKVGCKIYVRRGGPNYKAGLEKMRAVGDEIGIPIQVYGPEMHMTSIIPMALSENGKGGK
jgi:ATP-citrate lyase beta-subunit